MSFTEQDLPLHPSIVPQAAAQPVSEPQRLAAVRETAVLDTAPEQTYDDLTALAAHICGTPIALICLVDTHRVWFKSRVGLAATETPRERAFCAQTLLQPDELFEVPDARADVRFSDNPLVTGSLDICFYAGTPLLSAEGYAIGTLCVIDRKPRQLDADQRSALRTIGRLASALLRARRDDLRVREGQERFRTLLQQSLSGYAICALDGRITEVNDRCCEITGYTRERLLGSTIADLIHPDDRARSLALLEKLLATGELFQIEKRYVKADGSSVWVSNQMSLLHGPDGKPVAVMTLVQDIDHRKSLEKHVLEVDDRFIHMAQDAPLKMWITDATGSCTFINRHWCEFVGQAMETQLGLGWTTSLHPEEIQIAGEIFMAASNARAPFRKEFRLRKHDGSYHWHIDAAQPRFDDDGGFLGYIGSVVDVQDQHEQQTRLEREVAERTAELQQSEARYRKLSDDSPAIMMRCRKQPGWPVIYISKAAETITGYAPAVFTEQSLLLGSLMFEADVPQVLQRIEEGEARGGYIAMEYRFRHKDGSLRWVDLRALLITLPDGTPGYDATLNDITARKDVERELAARTDALERANAELDEFTYIASHDLKEPLRGIHNYARFIAEDYADKLDADGQQMLKAVSEQADRMQRLIEDLLEIARLGREPMQQASTDLDAVVDEVLASLAFSLAEKKVQVQKHTLGQVVCDRVRVAEVFRNLITNALKYNDKSEPVVEIGRRPSATGEPEFYVQDNGIGIKPDFHARVFAPFKRLHAKDAYGGGSGVGLTIVKRIVESHGGHIGVSSALGSGATFAFTLSGAHFS